LRSQLFFAGKPPFVWEIHKKMGLFLNVSWNLKFFVKLFEEN